MIGLVGAHRTGKSYTVKCMTERSMIDELKISVSQWQKEGGWDSSDQTYPWEERKRIQEYLFEAFSKRLAIFSITRAVTTNLVSERTPLDLIGYAYLNAPADPTGADYEWLYKYASICIELTNKYYSDIVLLQPGIPYVAASTSPGEESMEILNAHYLSVFMDVRLTPDKLIIPREVTDIDDRLDLIMEHTLWNTTGSQQ